MTPDEWRFINDVLSQSQHFRDCHGLQKSDSELDALPYKGQLLLDIHRPLLYQAQFRGHSQSDN
jgi:hypothetical protein